jgi:hypothetical protein
MGQTIIQRSKQDAGIVDDDIVLKEDPDDGDYLCLMHNFLVLAPLKVLRFIHSLVASIIDTPWHSSTSKENGRYLLDSQMRADPARMTPETWPREVPYITAYQVSKGSL